LIQGGTIKSGVRSTFSVEGAYWINCIQLILEDHLARRGREIGADHEMADPTDGSAACPFRPDIFRSILQAANEISAA